MGQQQILLVILVTVVIASSLVIAINVFGNASVEGNRASVRQDLISGAAYAQNVYMNSQMIGGAGRDFTNVEDNLLKLLHIPGIENQDGEWENSNGTYSVEHVETHSFSIRGRPATGLPDIILTLERDTENNIMLVSLVEDESN